MAFDYAGAKAAGYSDDEINAYLKNKGQSSQPDTLATSLRKIPLIGNTLSNVVSAGTGMMVNKQLPQVEELAKRNQEKARQLAISARNELDPETKKKMLDESRRLSQGTGDFVDKFANLAKQGTADFGNNGQTPNGVLNTIKTYAPAAVRSAVEVGSLIAPATSGITKVATTPLGQIGSATLGGGLTGFLSGAAEGDDKTVADRIQNGENGAIVGSLVSGGLAAGGQLVKTVADSPTFKQMVKNKSPNIFKAWGDLAEKAASDSGQTFDRKQFYTDLFNEASNKGPQTSLALKKEIVKNLESETGLKLKDAISMNPDDFSKLMDGINELDNFKSTDTMLGALTKRRDNASGLSKNLFGQVKQTTKNKVLLAENDAFNNQLKKILGVKNYDQYIKTGKMVLIGGGSFGAALKLLGLGKLLSGAQAVGDVAGM